jgi:3-oxoacyl-[acyl-carrier protein] reductase
MVAFVTGGNRGIGLATALALQESGHTVVIGSRDSSIPPPDRIGIVQIDVSDPQSINAAFDFIESSFGSVDVLVANAGVAHDSLLMRMSDHDIDDVLNTNLAGTIRLTRRALRPMVKNRFGRIIYVSSVVGLLGSAGQVNYSASKAGLIGAARSLTREVGSRGITVNVVAPGFIMTDMTSVLPEDTKASILQSIPAGRFGLVNEVASAINFLASDSSSYVSGAVIPIDGGLGMGH